MENQALQVRRHQDVHGRTGGHAEGTVLVVNACREEVGQNVVVVRRTDELANWQTDLFGVISRQDVTEVTCRNGEVDLVARGNLASLNQLSVGIDIVNNLWYQATDVHRVGR